jgi:hypothetical protein
LKTAPPTSDASRANAPLPEQRLKGVLDLSPGCAEGEVTENKKAASKIHNNSGINTKNWTAQANAHRLIVVIRYTTKSIGC